MKKALLAVTLFALGLTSVMAQAATIVYTGTGTLKKLSGSDPGGAGGKTGTIAISVSSTANPTSHTATSGTYRLAAGAIQVTFNGSTYSNSSAATMKLSAAAAASTITVTGNFSVSGVTAKVKGVVSLKKGSFTSAVSKHPMAFKPTPQTLTSPKSYITYTVPLIGATKLGINGSASN